VRTGATGCGSEAGNDVRIVFALDGLEQQVPFTGYGAGVQARLQKTIVEGTRDESPGMETK
jgi:hypothetical protein